jgi:hypothetical protein
MKSANPVGRTAVVLAAASVSATMGVYSLALIPLLFTGKVTITSNLPFVLGVLVVFLGVTLARVTIEHRLTPHEQAFLLFWVHAPYFTFLVACTLGALPLLLAFSAGPALGWSASTLSWVVRAIGLVVLVLSGLFVLVLWHRHQASLQSPPPGAGTRAA